MNSRSTCIFLCINFSWLGNSKLITKKVVANLLGYFLVETNGLYRIAYLAMILKLFPFLIRILKLSPLHPNCLVLELVVLVFSPFNLARAEFKGL